MSSNWFVQHFDIAYIISVQCNAMSLFVSDSGMGEQYRSNAQLTMRESDD